MSGSVDKGTSLSCLLFSFPPLDLEAAFFCNPTPFELSPGQDWYNSCKVLLSRKLGKKWKGGAEETGDTLYLVKCFMVVKDQVHVTNKPCHCIHFLSQPFLNQVQPHGFLKGLSIISNLGKSHRKDDISADIITGSDPTETQQK